MRVEQPPRCWQVFWRWLAVSPPLEARLWRAVARSNDPDVRAWRHVLLYYHPPAQRDPSHTHAFITGPLGPRKLVEMLEILVLTRALTRAEANQVESFVLQWTNHNGTWG